MNYRIANMNAQRATAKAKAGQLPGPEGSIGKMVLVNNQARLVKFISHVLGPKLIADSGEWGTYAWANFVLGAPGLRIAGGSDEVMRNIVGERVLGLPKEPGIDSRSPFKDIKVSTAK
jgi:alkylation response protein AidB-like acyl-CoA dehydrogenase